MRGDGDGHYFRLDRSSDSMTIVYDVAELRAEIERIEADGDVPQLLLIHGPHERQLGVVLAAEESVLAWDESLDGPYLVSRGPAESDEPFFDTWFGEHHTQFGRRNVIDRGAALAAAEPFIQTAQRPENVQWEDV